MPMFPDSGVPASDAKNSIDVNTPAGCDELWYSTSRCQPRFDPAAANAMLAEDMNLIMKGELQYDCARLDHIERAVRYISQRGLTTGTALWGGPFDYSCAMDPTLTRYNNFLTIVIVPNVNNQAAVRINVDGHGLVPLLRNDFQQLVTQDLRAGVPTIISYWNGNWFLVGLAASQVPLVVKGGIDAWIRPDGNDVTGDGTANTPDKAFKTIAGCWYAVGSRFAATPSFSINMKLGVPATYEGAAIGPFGGQVTLTGDEANPSAYRIRTTVASEWNVCMWTNGMNNMAFYGVTFEMDKGGPYGMCGLRFVNTSAVLNNCRVEVIASNPHSQMVEVADGSSFTTMSGKGVRGDVHFVGNNIPIVAAISCVRQSGTVGAFLNSGQTSYYHFTNINAGVILGSSGISNMLWSGATAWYITNCVGTQYGVYENSVLNMGGHPVPGTIAGTVNSGGRFIA